VEILSDPNLPEIILASSSPYRRQLLQRFGLPFTVVPPDIDETPATNEPGPELVLRLTETKARAVGRLRPGAIIIASDQVALCDGQIIGKPQNRAIASQQLARQSGRSVTFLTGIAVLDGASDTLHIDRVPCTVTFRELSEAQILRYLDRDQPYDCAGSFKSEALGIALLAGMDCPDPTALVGLPLIRLAAMLADVGIDLFLNARDDGSPPQ
jgi:septum formation protein